MTLIFDVLYLYFLRRVTINLKRFDVVVTFKAVVTKTGVLVKSNGKANYLKMILTFFQI